MLRNKIDLALVKVILFSERRNDEKSMLEKSMMTAAQSSTRRQCLLEGTTRHRVVKMLVNAMTTHIVQRDSQ